MAAQKYEFVDHTADIAIKAYGRDLDEAFANAATAMFDTITDGASIEAEKEVALEIEAIDREGLLVQFLSELILIHEVEGLVFSEFEVDISGENGLKAVCRGERFMPEKHGGGLHVKGVSYHMMEISDGSDGKPCYVQVLFDV
jgi:SHS2 domain-containing protein